MKSIALIDDSVDEINAFRKKLLHYPGVVLKSAATCIQDFFIVNAQESFDFIFLDIYLETEISIKSISKIRKRYPTAEIIMYTADEDFDSLFECLMLGASGYVIKSQLSNKFFASIGDLVNGDALLSPIMARKLIKYHNSKNQELITRDNEYQLTSKDLDLLSLLSKGWTYQYISKEMGLSLDGIRSRIRRLYRKLKVNTKMEAVQKYQRL